MNWLENLFIDGGLEAYFEASINQDVHECPHDVRAAAHLFHVLDNAGCWPSNSRLKIAELASSRLEQMLAERVITNACMVAEIRKEIAELHGRDSERLSTIHRPQP